MDSLETVGKVTKPFGRNGELVINIYDTFPDKFDTREPLFANIDSLAVPLFLEKFERRGQRGALVRFADFDTDTRSEELIGLELFLRIEKPEEDKDGIYFEDLVGFSASFDDNTATGLITGYTGNSQNPLFELTINGREAYVPAAGEMISALDIDKREIEFSLPEGLLDLYI